MTRSEDSLFIDCSELARKRRSTTSRLPRLVIRIHVHQRSVVAMVRAADHLRIWHLLKIEGSRKRMSLHWTLD